MNALALDERDAAIVTERMAKVDQLPGPRVGDYVRFSEGTLRRISYRWTDDAGWDGGCQTSDGGSYHLSSAGVSMSGSLHPAIPTESLTETDERRDGSVWIFHHDLSGAGRGVTALVPFRVYETKTTPTT